MEARRNTKYVSRRILVGCRLLHVVDDEDIDRTSLRIEFEAELLLQRCKNRWTGVDRSILRSPQGRMSRILS
jgi:hypothetical protein